MGLSLSDLYNTVLYTSLRGIDIDIIEGFHALDINIRRYLLFKGSLIRHPGDESRYFVKHSSSWDKIQLAAT